MPNGHYSNKGNVPAKASCFDSKLQRMEFAWPMEWEHSTKIASGPLPLHGWW